MGSPCLRITAVRNLLLLIYQTLHVNPSILLINKMVPWHYNNRDDNTSSNRSKIIPKGTTHLQNTLLWLKPRMRKWEKIEHENNLQSNGLQRVSRSKLSFSIMGKIKHKEGNWVAWRHPWLGTGAQVLTLNLVLSSLCHLSGILTPTQCSQLAVLGEKGRATEEVKGAFLHSWGLWTGGWTDKMRLGNLLSNAHESLKTKQALVSTSNPLHVKRLSYSRLFGITLGEK